LNTKKVVEPTPAPAPAPKKAAPAAQAAPADYKPAATAEPQDPYGDLIPFADPSWYQGVSIDFVDFLFDGVIASLMFRFIF
jgi:hypothetical protein